MVNDVFLIVDGMEQKRFGRYVRLLFLLTLVLISIDLIQRSMLGKDCVLFLDLLDGQRT